MTSRVAATRYARALFDVARKEGDIQQAGRDIEGFARLVAENEPLSRAFANPAIPAQRKRAVVEQLFAAAGPTSPIVQKLVLMLAERDRLVLLPELATAYEARLMENAQVVHAQLTTAVALPQDRIAALQQGLARATGREVQLAASVDPSIIGGAVARIGSTVYDGSVTTQLQKVKERLTAAAAE
ncbi:MAG: ATP synthase F1 subunit delta [Acidobacteriota bacterium]|jgi:F-type H+-transporting ATPase subunit delta|nr:ATP synthase F1 subunit delta [Acidobacteriota bacterium]MDQ3419216.1 ATP synthase F1 subunit delta [Acidobacteriota bacterium]